MNESKHFEEIPDDVKQEMLMLFETYSRNDLINKLRSLREPSSKSSEKTLISESICCKNQLNFSERVGTKSKNALACTNNTNLNDINASSQNSPRSIHERNPQQSSKNKHSQSIINSVSDNLVESSNLNYACIQNNFYPVVLQKTNPDSCSANKKNVKSVKSDKVTNSCDINVPLIEPSSTADSNLNVVSDKIQEAFLSDVKTEEVYQQNVGKKGIKRIRKKRSWLVNNTKANIQIGSSDETSNSLSLNNQPSDVIQVSSVFPEASLQSKSSLKCKKGKHSEAKQGMIPNLTKSEVDIKLPLRTSYKKLNQKNKTNGVNLKSDKNINVNLVETSNTDSNMIVISDKNKINNIRSSDLFRGKKKNLKLLKADKITYSCDINVTETTVTDRKLNVVSDKNKIIGLKSSDSSAAEKNVKLLKADKISDINVPVIETATADSNFNVVCDKNKNVCLKSSDSSSVKKDNVELLKTDKITDSYDINVTLTEPSNADSKINIVSKKNKVINVKRSNSTPAKKKKKFLKITKITDFSDHASDIKVPLVKPCTVDNNVNVVNCGTSVPVIETSNADTNLNDISNENKIISVRSSDLSPAKKKNLKLLKTSKITDSNDQTSSINVPLTKPSSTDNNVNISDRNKIINLKSSDSNPEINISVTVEGEKNIDIKNANTEILPLLPTNDNTSKIDNCTHSKVSLNNHVEASKPVDHQNAPTITEFESNEQNFVAKSVSLRKRILSNTEVVSAPNLKLKSLKKKIRNSKNGINKQLSSLNYVLVDDYVKSAGTSAKLNSEERASKTSKEPHKSCISGRKMSAIVLPNNGAISNMESKILTKEESSSNIYNEEKQENTSKTCESNLSVPNTDLTLAFKLREKIENNNEIESCENTSDEMQQNAEAYSKLSKLCSLHGLNLDDIFRRKEVQEMLEKFKNNPDAIVFIGTHKSPSSGKVEPVVHVHKSKKVLLETLAEIQSKNSSNSKVANN
ncbi:serine-rich adhesin for platelets-like [Parasteatoda tepidariorum]|uniref:serine-rich adhesin for platelets-like n=1 Tax=Parasteatoda tepidariorum TaxID=114398 RepID=UPI0039BD55FA